MKTMRFWGYCLPYLFTLIAYSTYGNARAPEVSLHETAHIHANGAGSFEITIDLSKVEQLIKMASFLANITPEAAKKEVQAACAAATHSLEHVAGISNVNATYDTKMLCFKLCFQFNKIQALNEAMRKLYAHIDHPGATYFKIDRHAFSRTDTIDVAQLLTHYCKEDSTKIETIVLKNILNITTYNIAYSFDRKVKNIDNTRAHISEDRKRVVLTQSLADASVKGLSLSNKVFF
ncbi:MAG: hypothetical protein ACX93T_00970 [Bacteroidota bacterium]